MYFLSPILTLLVLGFSGAKGSFLRHRLLMPARDYGSISGTSMATNAGKVEATVTSERGEESFVAIDGDTSEDEGRDANAEKKRTKEPNIDILIDSDGS